MKLRRAFHTLAFLVVTALLYAILVQMFSLRTVDVSSKDEFFSDTPEGLVEVLFLGNSKMATGGNPETLWNEFGIPSFNYANGAQTPWQAYYGLRAALKKQTPKVVVWEISTFTSEEAFGYDFPINVTTNYLPLSLNKVEYLRSGEGMDWEAVLEHLMVLPALHAKWEGLNRYDFLSWHGTPELPLTKGFLPWFRRTNEDASVTGETILKACATEDTLPLQEKATLYFEKMVALCKENGIELVLFASPSTCDATGYGKYNTIRQLAEQNDCLFLDGLDDYASIGLNWVEDMSDGAHPNYNGSVKISSYLGKQLQRRFALADHRKDAAYAYWDTDGTYFADNADTFWDEGLTDIYQTLS